MKFCKNVIRIFATAVIISILMTALPAMSVLAQYEHIYLYPDEGEVGDYVNIEGVDFEESYYNSETDYYDSYVDIYFSSDEADENDDINDEVRDYELVRSGIWVDEYGGFDTYFYVPDELTDGYHDEYVHGGTYYVHVTYEDDNNIVAVGEFTVVAAEIDLDPNDGPVGTEIDITGIDFSGNKDITIEYDGDETDIKSGDDETDSYGEFECSIIIPESTAGEHTITVTDDSGVVAEADFTVEPFIYIIPESGAAGQTVTVGGTGFGGELDYVIYFDNYEVFDDETDEYGSFVSQCIVPALGSRAHDVEVWDDDDNSAEAEFTIGEVIITINPTSGSAGTEVTVSGTGFISNKSVSIAFDDDYIDSKSASATGTFSASFIIPSLSAGTYKVKVTDGTNTDLVNFKISASTSISPVTSTASPGHIGTELTLSGTGFIAGKTVTVTYDGTQVTTNIVNPDGTFSAVFNAPASSGGAHNILVTDGTNQQQLTFVMESTPPSTIYPQLPLMDSKLEDWRFDWCGDAIDLSKEVTDDSPPVHYTLQIATDQNFSQDSIVLDIKELSESEYILAEEEHLESVSKDTPYYWRVKAMDAASNETEWTGIGTFYVGFSWRLPQWAVYVLIIIGALLIGGGLGFWLGRRMTPSESE